jgi:inorganic triphosphatase YgiF
MGTGRHQTGNKRAGAHDAPREIELKLEVDPGAIGTLLAHPLVAGHEDGAGSADLLQAIYYDTPDEALRRAGISLRTRRHADGWVQTIKADRSAKGLALDRQEWETPVPDAALDLDAATGTALEPLLAKKKVRKGLAPVFTVVSERNSFALERDGAALDLVLDRAEVSANGASRRFGEIEIELRRGDPAALFRVALDLADVAPMRLSFTTKSARGYALLNREPPKGAKADRVAFAPDATSAEAFQAIAQSCLAQAIQNEAVVRQTRDPAALHQFRVGLRRLRAAISFFKDMLKDPQSDALRDELRAVSQELGAVRDLDVYVERLRDAGALIEAQARRVTKYDELLANLDRPRFWRTTLMAAAWIEAGDWLTSADENASHARERPIEARATEQLSRRWKRVLKRGRHLGDLDPDARHRVRIEIKKLRYGVEFFHGLFDGRKAKARRKNALEVLEDLQETLGYLNDIAVGGIVAGMELRTEADANPAAQEEALVGRAQEAVKRLATLKPFWT